MSDVPDKVVEQIQKLLNLAARNPSEGEASSAAAKAQELLERYNLDVDFVQGKKAGGGAREKAAVVGGQYHFQRDIWKAVGELHFCIYWYQRYWDREAENKSAVKKYKEWGYGAESARASGKGRYRYRHVLVGKKVNVAATKAIAGYLEQATDRLTMERLGNDNSQRYSQWANSYRRGIASRLCQKLRTRRNEVLGREMERRAAEDRAADNPGTGGGLTLMRYVDEEYDANIDFMHGEGTAARWASERVQAAAEAKAEHEAYVKWAAEHPEEAAEAERQRREEAGKYRRRGRGGLGRQDNVDQSAYWSGYDAGNALSIDPQTSHDKPAGLL